MSSQDFDSQDKKPDPARILTGRVGTTRLGSLSSTDGGGPSRSSQGGKPAMPVSLRPGQPPVSSESAPSASGTADFTHGGVRKTKFVPKVPARRSKKAAQDKESEEGTDDKLTGELRNILNAQQLSQQGPGGFGLQLRGAAAPTRVAFGYGGGSSAFGSGMAIGSSTGGGGFRKDGVGGGGGGGGGGKGGGRMVDQLPSIEALNEDFQDLKGKSKKKYVPPYDYVKRNAPLVLPYPAMAETEDDDDEQLQQMTEDATGRLLEEEEEAASAAQELRLMPGMDGVDANGQQDLAERLLFLQLPGCLPISTDDDDANDGDGDAGGRDRRREGGGDGPGEDNGAGPWASGGAQKKTPLPQGMGLQQPQPPPPRSPVALEAVRRDGYVGKLLVYESGAVKMRVGDILFDVSPGARCNFHQELVAIDIEEKSCHFLGSIDQRMIISPDIDHILNV